MDPITATSNWFYRMLEAEITYIIEVTPIKLRIFWYDVQLFWLGIKIGWMKG